MRTLALVLVTPMLGLAVPAQSVSAQAQKYYQSAGEVTAPAATPDNSNLTGVSLIAQADTFVSMAATAPPGATYAATRQSNIAARAASDALDAAAAEYSNGHYEAADSMARVAIGMAELATQIATRRPDAFTVVEPNPAPGVLITQDGDRVPNSYAGLTPQPSGSYPAGPYPPMLRDSLPFGATPVGIKPSLIAP
jgi:hypothetical protein